MNESNQESFQLKKEYKTFLIRFSQKRTLSRLKSQGRDSSPFKTKQSIQEIESTNSSQRIVRSSNTQFCNENNRYENKPKSQAIIKRSVVQKQLFSLQIPFFRISAQCWAIYNGNNCEFISGFNHHKKRQIASLTKIVTCIVCLNLSQTQNFDIHTKRFFVPEQAQRIGGTSASLIKGDSIIIKDLLYALMLPSGNDAAITIAYNFQLYSLESDHFLKEMNRYVLNLGLQNTYFGNVHGLFCENSFSTCNDIGIITQACLQNNTFCQIVNSINYSCQIYNQPKNILKEMYWENTNKLLQLDNYFGVKTGITKEAGPCVVEFYQNENKSYIIVLLNCSTAENRWIDAQKLVKWILKQQK